jgi:hypothetical protein
VPPEETHLRNTERATPGVHEQALSSGEATGQYGRPDGSSAEKSAEPPAMMISVPIKSKLGLEPSDHHENSPRKAVEDSLPVRRARIRRQRW